MVDNRPTVYSEGDNWIYRASGSGACLRYLVAIGLGYDEQRGKKWDDLLERSANEGRFHEDTIIQTLEEAGEVEVKRAQEEINIQVIPKVFLRGHIEGLIHHAKYHANTCWELLEIKSMSNKQFQKWTNHGFDKFAENAFQISTYMEAFPEYDVRYMVKRREDGLVSERTIPAGEPPIPFSQVRKKIILAEKYRRKGELPPCDIDNQWGCPVWYLHDEETDEEIIPLSEEEEEIVGELAEEFLTHKRVEDLGKEAEKKRKALSPQILNLLGKLDQTEISFNGKRYRVTRKKGGGHRYDDGKLLEMLGEDRLEEAKTKYRYEYPIIIEIE